MDTFIIRLLNLQEKLFRIALFLTRDRNRAKDLLQETFLRVLENKEKFKTDDNLCGWANKIMSNIFISDYRKIINQQKYICTTNVDDLHSLSEQSFLRNHSISELSDAIEKLDIKKQVVIKLFLSGYKYEEIAQKENLPIGTVKSQIHHAKEDLKNLLK